MHGSLIQRRRFPYPSVVSHGIAGIQERICVVRHEFRGSAQRRKCILALPQKRQTQQLPKYSCTRVLAEQSVCALFGVAQAALVEQVREQVDVGGLERFAAHVQSR
jgi:hypothetical protein